MHRLIVRIMPFIFLGMILVVLIAGLILFSYLLIFGALIGLALFIISWIKEKFFPTKHLTPYEKQRSKKEGRTFDHDEHQ